MELNDLLSKFGNILYGTIVIVDSDGGTIEYLSDKSELFKILNPNSKTIDELLNKKEEESLKKTLEAIRSYYEKISEKDIKDLVFNINTICNISLKKHIINIKMTPFWDKPDNSNLFLCYMSLSSFSNTESLQVENNITGEKEIYDFSSGRWEKEPEIKLSETQKNVLANSAKGMTINEIADRLCLAPESVKSIRKRLFEKIGVNNITEALMYAINNKLL